MGVFPVALHTSNFGRVGHGGFALRGVLRPRLSHLSGLRSHFVTELVRVADYDLRVAADRVVVVPGIQADAASTRRRSGLESSIQGPKSRSFRPGWGIKNARLPTLRW